MRRKEKQIENAADLEALISKVEVCHLAMSFNEHPYVVPLNFGYQEGVLYFHSAAEGKKLDIIRRNPQVCFAMHLDEKIIEADKACNFTTQYQSIIGFGKAAFITCPEEKTEAMNIIMGQYTNRTWEYPAKMLEKTTLVKIDIEEMTGKQSLA